MLAINRPVEPTWPGGAPGKVDIAIVGEAPGQDEVIQGRPFVGSSGRLLDNWLKNAGIDRGECLVTNTFRYKAAENDMRNFFHKKLVAARLKKETGWASPFPVYGDYGFVKQHLEDELHRLYKELEVAKPNLVVTLGATALWALTGEHKIGNVRGTLMTGVHGLKVLPTYHPAAVLRNWGNYPVCCADLMKAKREAATPTIERKVRNVYVAELQRDVEQIGAVLLADDVPGFSFDIETDPPHGFVTCIGFAPSDTEAYVIPFYSSTVADGNYWPTVDAEVFVWSVVKRVLESSKKKVAHNISYDAMWLYAKHGIRVAPPFEDTMHMHHAMQPELQKSLAFLGSIYTNEKYWKDMVKFKTGKANDKA